MDDRNTVVSLAVPDRELARLDELIEPGGALHGIGVETRSAAIRAALRQYLDAQDLATGEGAAAASA